MPRSPATGLQLHAAAACVILIAILPTSCTSQYAGHCRVEHKIESLEHLTATQTNLFKCGLSHTRRVNISQQYRSCAEEITSAIDAAIKAKRTQLFWRDEIDHRNMILSSHAEIQTIRCRIGGAASHGAYGLILIALVSVLTIFLLTKMEHHDNRSKAEAQLFKHFKDELINSREAIPVHDFKFMVLEDDDLQQLSAKERRTIWQSISDRIDKDPRFQRITERRGGTDYEAWIATRFSPSKIDWS